MQTWFWARFLPVKRKSFLATVACCRSGPGLRTFLTVTDAIYVIIMKLMKNHTCMYTVTQYQYLPLIVFDELKDSLNYFEQACLNTIRFSVESAIIQVHITC